MSFWAVKRESVPLAVGLHRTEEGMIEGWAVNLTLLPKTVDLTLKIWDVRDGTELLSKVVCKDFALAANRSTELTALELPENYQSHSVVVAAYLFESKSMTMVARHINFHEPLKEVPFQRPRSLSARICSGASDPTWIELNAELPVKGVLVEVKGEAGDNVLLDDNGVNLVPGGAVRLAVRGLEKVDRARLSLRWLGGSQEFDCKLV